MVATFCTGSLDKPEIAWVDLPYRLAYGDQVEVNGELFKVIGYRLVIVRGDDPFVKYLLEQIWL